MIKIFSILSFIFISFSIQAQWSELGGDTSLKARRDKNPNGNWLVNVNSSVLDKKGNFYTTGGFKNDSGYYYVAKFDGKNWSELGKNSNLKFKSVIHSMWIDKNDTIYVGGELSDTVKGDFLDSIVPYYIAKFNGKDWVKLGKDFELASLGDYKIKIISSLTGDSKGNVYAGCQTHSDSNISFCFVAKYDGKKWIALKDSITLRMSMSLRLKCDKNDKIYCLGNYPINGINYVKVYNGSKWVYLKGIEDIKIQFSYGFGIDTFNTLYFGSYSFDKKESYIVKFDGENWTTLKKNKILNSEFINSIFVDNNQNIFTLSSESHLVDSTKKLLLSYYKDNKWTDSYLIRQNKFGGGNHFFNNIITDNKDKIYIVDDFDLFHGFGYVLKYTMPSLSSISNQKRDNFSIYPNPCSNCELTTSKLINKDLLMVTDVLGKKVSAKFEKSPNGYKINLASESKGIYFLMNIESDENLRFVKE